jgi:alpha-beta hydrolase superfamily lysophospholipase
LIGYRHLLLYPVQLSFCSLALMMLSACSQQPIANKPYPVWGKTISLARNFSDSRHMQLLEPLPDKPAEVCILIVHGMNEYIGRYTEIARYFAQNSIVAGVDLTAHGLSNPVIAHANQQINSGKKDQDVGQAFQEQAPLRDLSPMRKDLKHALHFLVEQCDQVVAERPLPLFILSHSLGSLVSASYLLQTDDEILKKRISGIIFTGPAFSVTEVPGWRGWLQNPLIRFTYHTHEHFLNPHDEALPLMLFNQLLALSAVPIQDGLIELLSLPVIRDVFSPSTPDWVVNYLSDSEEERTRHRKDPFIVRKTVLRYVLGVEKEVIKFRRTMASFKVPYLLIYSEFDPITPAWGSADFLAATQHNHPHNEALMLARKSHHEQLFSEPVLRQQILDKIQTWIRLRSACSNNC